MGLNALPLFTVKLDGVKVPLANRLGGEDGHDFAPLLASFQISMAALAVGMARPPVNMPAIMPRSALCSDPYIAQKQSIAFMLAEMATEVEAIRLLTWEAAWQLDNGDEGAAHTAYLAYMGAVDMVYDRHRSGGADPWRPWLYP